MWSLSRALGERPGILDLSKIFLFPSELLLSTIFSFITASSAFSRSRTRMAISACWLSCSRYCLCFSSCGAVASCLPPFPLLPPLFRFAFCCCCFGWFGPTLFFPALFFGSLGISMASSSGRPPSLLVRYLTTTTTTHCAPSLAGGRGLPYRSAGSAVRPRRRLEASRPRGLRVVPSSSTMTITVAADATQRHHLGIGVRSPSFSQQAVLFRVQLKTKKRPTTHSQKCRDFS